MPFIDGGTLTDSQRQLLESFEAVTSTASETRGDEGAVQRQRRRRRRAINLLEKTGWNVEVSHCAFYHPLSSIRLINRLALQTAIARVFDGDEDLDRDDAGLDDSGDEGSGNLQSRFRTGQDDESRRPLMDTFGIDDSATVVVPSDASGARRRGPVGPRGSNGGPAYWIRQVGALHRQSCSEKLMVGSPRLTLPVLLRLGLLNAAFCLAIEPPRLACWHTVWSSWSCSWLHRCVLGHLVGRSDQAAKLTVRSVPAPLHSKIISQDPSNSARSDLIPATTQSFRSRFDCWRWKLGFVSSPIAFAFL